MLTRLARLAVITLLGLFLNTPTAAQTVDRIAFQARVIDDPFAPWDIFSIRVEGSDLVNLTRSESSEITPAWSPDGEKIAFASDEKGSLQIYVMDVDGSNREQLTLGPGDHLYPAWSPDGRQLAYSANERGDYDIYVMQADGSDAVNVTQSPGVDVAPSWSPDGAMLAFASDRDREASLAVNWRYVGGIRLSASDIFVMDALGGAATNLTLGLSQRSLHNPSWSPAGESIVFASDSSIRLVDAGGSDSRVLPLGEVLTTQTPSWSRDGAMIAFARMIIGRGTQGVGIWLAPSSGGQPTQLTGNDWYSLHPTWSSMTSLPPPSTPVAPTPWGELKQRLRKGR